MAKSSLQKAIEKQQKEAKRMAENEARRQRASQIISGQPIVGGMRIMDPSAEELFKIMLSKYEPNDKMLVSGMDDCFPSQYHFSLLTEFEKLAMYGVVSNPHHYMGGQWSATLTPQGLTYFKDKETAMEKDKQTSNAIHIENLNATGSNVVFGNIINSSLSIDNSISQIEKEIEENGGEDKAELREILAEVKELTENIQNSRCLPKNSGLLKRLSGHLSKHGWFYGEVTGLLGSVVIKMLQG